jgi:hypothetical protein
VVFNKILSEADLGALREILEKYPGNDKVYFGIKINNEKKLLATSYLVDGDSIFEKEITDKFGPEVSVRK